MCVTAKKRECTQAHTHRESERVSIASKDSVGCFKFLKLTVRCVFDISLSLFCEMLMCEKELCLSIVSNCTHTTVNS